MPDKDVKLCPSAQPDMPDAVAFGVIGGTAEEPVASYLKETIPVTPELLELARPVKPTEVFRFAARCAESGCQHFSGNNCLLAAKISADVPTSFQKLPPCKIRGSCRWWAEQGRSACFRCPLIVTEHHSAGPDLRAAASPETPSTLMPRLAVPRSDPT
jgi:hypothetical protein